MRTTILTILAAFLASLANSQPTTTEQWAQFKTTHKRQYSSLEEAKRFKIFSENVAKIEAHNIRYRNGEVTYYQGMNKFGDLTGEEFLAFINRTNSHKAEASKNFYGRHTMSKKSAAPEVDWTTKGAVTRVKDEGECSSSWSFSAAGAVEGQLAIKSGQLVSLSEQNLIDCSKDFGNNGCDGGFINSAFDYIQENGVMSESDYPYEGQLGSCRFDISGSVTSITGYNLVDSFSEVSLQDAVQTVGPVAAAIDATETLQFYYGGILFDDICNINQSDLNHGVLIVGYGTEYQFDYWIVKNSWGTDWGQNGFYKSIRNYGNNCGIATSASYPII